MQRDILRIALFPDLPDEFVEEVLAAAVRAYDFQLAAPGDARVGDRVEFARILVQREFVKQTVAAFAGLRVRAARHRVDMAAVGEFEHVGLFVLHDAGSEVFRGQVQDRRETLAVVQEKTRLDFVAA